MGDGTEVSMSKYWQDYIWKNGSPYGVRDISDNEWKTAYKIVSDPYHKRIAVEKYVQGNFSAVIYDSALLDFRHLKALEQAAWEKTIIKEDETSMECLIRNQDDRVVLIETYHFEAGRCRRSTARSPQGILLSQQRIFYRIMDDSFDGVCLYDAEERLVMQKKYAVDVPSGEFTTLLEEKW
jgi:hypothetical protein